MCRIKNKFLLTEYETEDGYRDVSLNVLFEVCALKIVDSKSVKSKRRHGSAMTNHCINLTAHLTTNTTVNTEYDSVSSILQSYYSYLTP